MSETTYREINVYGHRKHKSEIVGDIAEMLGLTGKLEMAEVHGGGNKAIYLNNHRIAGGKPWGGGTVAQTWDVSVHDVLSAIIPDHESALEIARSLTARKETP